MRKRNPYFSKTSIVREINGISNPWARLALAIVAQGLVDAKNGSGEALAWLAVDGIGLMELCEVSTDEMHDLIDELASSRPALLVRAEEPAEIGPALVIQLGLDL